MPNNTMSSASRNPPPTALAYLGAGLAVAVGVTLSLGLHAVLPKVNVLLVLLLAVLVVASRSGLGPSLLACVLGVAAFNFFFTEPYYSFKMAHRADVTTLLFFIVMAVLTANLAMQMRHERRVAERTARHANNLYELSRRLVVAADRDTVFQAVVEHLAATLHGAAMIRDTTGRTLSRAGMEALLERLHSAPGQATASLTLEEEANPVTLLVLADGGTEPGEEWAAESSHALVRAVRDQAVVTLERIRLADDLEQTRIDSETERLRNALLASLSHDLRTPLASVIGSLSTVRDCGANIDEATRDDLLLTAEQEAGRLDRYIENLLDMTRIEHGMVGLQRDWTDPRDLVSAAVRRVEAAHPRLLLSVALAADTPLIYVHGVLIETVLVNLLDNAARYSPAGAEVLVEVAPQPPDQVEIAVTDAGPGIPEKERARVFERFFRGSSSDHDRHGSGLGLTICAGLVGAHGGEIVALAGPGGRGTRMRVRLPLAPPGTLPPAVEA